MKKIKSVMAISAKGRQVAGNVIGSHGVFRPEIFRFPDAIVERWLNVCRKPTADFDHVQLPDLGREALILMGWNATNNGLEDIPF